MKFRLDVALTPAEFPVLQARDLSGVACVVLDILRATSTMVTAFAAGARAIRPVATVEEAVACRRACPDLLLAGEREGVRIRAELTGGLEFDLGNSPREFTPARVGGRALAMTTTNGTRAFRACAHATWVAAGAFLNLHAVAQAARATGLKHVLIVCSGTGEALALEDAAAAGALAELWSAEAELSDAATSVLALWRSRLSPPAGVDAGFFAGANGRRLAALPELAPDLAFCGRRDVFTVVPVMDVGGELRLGAS